MAMRLNKAIGPATSGSTGGIASARSLHIVSRTRLFDLYGIEPKRKVTVIQAPAGYGKTEYLVQWLSALQSRGLRAALIRLDPSHDNLQQLLVAMTAVVGRLGFDAPDMPARDMDDRDSFCRATLSMVANVLGSTKRPVVVLVDDTHWIRSNEALRAFDVLLQRTPDHVRFILASRRKPMLSLARVAAAGQLARVIGQTLLFTSEETFLALQRLASHEEAIEIHALMSGWPALVNLLVSDVNFPNRLRTLRSGLVDGEMGDFLESILSEVQPDAARKCIVTSALGERFSAALAGAICGRDDAEALLDMASQSGTPLLAQDGTKDLAYPQILRMWLLLKLRTDPAHSLSALHERCARWLTKEGRAQEAVDHILQGPLRTLGDFAALESRGLSLIWRFGPRALAAYAPPPIPDLRYPRFARAHSLACRLDGRKPHAAPLPDIGDAAGDMPDDAAEQLIADAWRCVLGDIAIGESEITGIQALIVKFERHPADNLADITHLLLAISAFDTDDCLQAALHGLEAHDRLVAGSRPYAAYIARMYCGFATARAGKPLPALAHFRACATLAAVELPGEQVLNRAQTCVSQILCWLGAAPHAANLPGIGRQAESMDIDAIPPSFAARIDVAYRTSLLRGTSAQARTILERGAAQARAQGWHRVAVGLECSLVEHVIRFNGPAGIFAGLDVLASDGATLNSPHLQQRVALADARVRIARGDLQEALRRIDEMLSAAETAPTTLAVCAAFLRFGLLLIGGDSTMSEPAGAQLLAVATNCPCVALLADDFEILSRHVTTDAGRKRLTAMLAQLKDHAQVALKSTTPDSLPDTKLSALSPRERDVLDLVTSGMSRREISEFLGVSESSVKSYQTSLFGKLRVTRRSDAIQEAKRCGLWQGTTANY
jgi:LuxR family maltose regulon positive regulatory protein